MNIKKHFHFFLIGFFFLMTYNLYGNNALEKKFKTLSTAQKCYYFITLNNDEKKECFQYIRTELNKLNQKNLNKNDQINLKISLGLIEKYNGNNIQSILKLNELLIDNSNSIHPKYLMIIYLSLYESYLSLNIFSKAFEINTKIKALNPKGIDVPVWNYNLHSRLLYQMGNYKQAITQLHKEIDALKKNSKRDSLVIPSATNDLGLYYFVVDDFDKGAFYFNKSLELAKKSLDTLSKDYTSLYLTTRNNLARLRVEQNENTEAIRIISEDVFPKINPGDEVYTEASYILANAQLNKHDFLNFKKTQLYNAKHQDDHPNYKYQFLSFQISYLKLQGQYKEALALFKEFYTLRSKEFTESNNEQSRNQEIGYLLLENENTIRQKNKELEDRYTKIMVFLIVFFALTIIIISYLYVSILKRKRQIEKMNVAISNQKDEIEHSLKEKEILLKEIHHRVKNNLQIISSILDLQLLNTDNEELIEKLKEGQNRIQTIALIHKNMYQKELYSEVNFKEYIEELIQQIQSSLINQKEIEITYDIQSVLLPLDHTIPLSLIVTEIISNSFKHAFQDLESGTIRIYFQEVSEKNYLLRISDNGKGFDINQVNTNDSIGLDLIHGLAEQINGEVAITSSLENGTQTTILFTTHE